MNDAIARLIEAIAALPDEWHTCGTVSTSVLRAIARHAEEIGPIRHSVETGSGKTTLLFSHLSADHLAFSVDYGSSISQVVRSPLFKSDTTRFITGPSQQTLPQHRFVDKLQIALIDGPHGYPFPDLEYYYLYPLIETGGMLLVDDIKIPSIRRMYEIIKADEMFDLVEIVDHNTAFFRRTASPIIDPLSDSWWLQSYNRPYYLEITKAISPAEPQRATVGALTKLLTRSMPKVLKQLIPARAKSWLKRQT